MKKNVLILVLSLPFLYLIIKLFVIESFDPIKEIYIVTGVSALVLLYATITISILKKWYNLLSYRRILGFSSFFYATLHFLNFIILDSSLDISFIFENTLEKPFIYLGLFSYILLVLLALTSVTRKMYTKYKKFHSLIYLSILVATIHFVIAGKAIVTFQIMILSLLVFIAFLKARQKLF